MSMDFGHGYEDYLMSEPGTMVQACNHSYVGNRDW
jgi:hypothetical protein